MFVVLFNLVVFRRRDTS